MKALLVETDDYQTLYLDGRLVGENHSLDVRQVLEAVLGKDNVETKWIDGPYDYIDYNAKLAKAYEASQKPNEEVRRTGIAFLNARAEANRAFRKAESLDQEEINMYRAFEVACREQGIPFPAPELLERLKKEING